MELVDEAKNSGSSASASETKESKSKPGVFSQQSSMCIVEILPTECMIAGDVKVNLELLAKLLPIRSPECTSSTILGIKFGSIERGVIRANKSSAAEEKRTREGSTPSANNNSFQNQVQLRLCLPDAKNVSIKFFKTGRLQTAGCRTREMSIKAVQDVTMGLAFLADMEGGDAVFSHCTPETSRELCKTAHENVRVTKEHIFGSFTTGFSGPRGNHINMRLLAAMLTSKDFKPLVDRIKFNAEPSMQEAKFKQLGTYLKKDALRHAEQNVFVNIFSSGKCIVTSATSTELAKEVVDVVINLLCSNYDRIVEDHLATSYSGHETRLSTSVQQKQKHKTKHTSSPFHSRLCLAPSNAQKHKRVQENRSSYAYGSEDFETSESQREGSTGSSEASSFSPSSIPSGVQHGMVPMNDAAPMDGLVPMMQVVWCKSDLVPGMLAAGWRKPKPPSKQAHTDGSKRAKKKLKSHKTAQQKDSSTHRWQEQHAPSSNSRFGEDHDSSHKWQEQHARSSNSRFGEDHDYSHRWQEQHARSSNSRYGEDHDYSHRWQEQHARSSNSRYGEDHDYSHRWQEQHARSSNKFGEDHDFSHSFPFEGVSKAAQHLQGSSSHSTPFEGVSKHQQGNDMMTFSSALVGTAQHPQPLMLKQLLEQIAFTSSNQGPSMLQQHMVNGVNPFNVYQQLGH